MHHDIGKLQGPSDVLNKPEASSDVEYEAAFGWQRQAVSKDLVVDLMAALNSFIIEVDYMSQDGRM